MTAYLDGADLTWEVLRVEDGSTMAQVNDIGPLTLIDINAMGDGDFHINLIFEGEPSAVTAPAGITIDIRPDGATGPAWQSDGAPYPPKLMLERLDLDGAGRMEARFVASLSFLVFRGSSAWPDTGPRKGWTSIRSSQRSRRVRNCSMPISIPSCPLAGWAM